MKEKKRVLEYPLTLNVKFIVEDWCNSLGGKLSSLTSPSIFKSETEVYVCKLPTLKTVRFNVDELGVRKTYRYDGRVWDFYSSVNLSGSGLNINVLNVEFSGSNIRELKMRHMRPRSVSVSLDASELKFAFKPIEKTLSIEVK